MSKIKEIVQSRMNELAFLEMQKDIDDGLIVDQTMKSISLRVSKDLITLIDIIADKLQLSRSDVIRSFLSAGASEAFQELDMSTDEVIAQIEMFEEKEIERHISEGENK